MLVLLGAQQAPAPAEILDQVRIGVLDEPARVRPDALVVGPVGADGIDDVEAVLLAEAAVYRQALLKRSACRLGVAARLSRYLQVLTQAKKMGRETISSQELSDYTHVNSTQIRRDLSGFGKFGKRGVGYNVDSLVEQIRKILRTAGQHNIALFGADHGFRVVAIFDSDRSVVGQRVGSQTVRHSDELEAVVEHEDIVVGVLAVPTTAAQQLADELVGAGVKIIFNYSEALLSVPPDVTVHTSSPAVDLLYALYFYLT